MKKVLSFVLVLAMILGCTAMAFATPAGTAKTLPYKVATPFPDAQDNYIATILKDLGILKGDENGKANLDQAISRAEFVTILLRTLGLESISSAKTATKFKDVPATAWYSGYVAQAVEQGITDGVSKTEFNPLGLVSADEALAFVCKLLGYDAEHIGGSWPSNYRAQALKCGIVPDDFENGASEITRGVVFQILYKALDKQTQKWNKVFEEFRDNGLLVAGTGLTTTVANKYQTTYSAYVDKTLVDAYKDYVDLSAFLGQTVNFLTKGVADESHIIGVAKVASKTLEGKFSGVYTTFTAIDKTAYTMTPDMLSGAAYYYNGECKTTLTQASLELDTISNASFTLEVTLDTVRTNTINKVYSVSVWIGEDKLVSKDEAKALAKEPASIFTEYSFPTTKAAAGSNKMVVDYSKFTLVGAEKISDIAENDVVRVYCDPANFPTQKKVVKLVVVRDAVVGAVTNIKSDKYTVNGTAYEYAKLTAPNTVTPKAAHVQKGTEFAFYLNEDGKIFYSNEYENPVAEVAWTYAYVLEKVIVPGKAQQALGATTAVTYCALRLLPVGTDEYVDFATEAILTEKGIGYAVATDAAAGDVVKYKLDSKGAMTTIAAVEVANNATTTNTTATAKKTINGVAVADNAVVAYMSTKETNAAKLAHYSFGTYDEISGKTYAKANITYYADETGKIVLVQIGGVAVTDKTEYVVSVAAFLGYEETVDGTYATFLVDGVEEEYLCSDSAVIAPAIANNAQMYRLTFKKADDKLVSTVAIEGLYACANLATNAGINVVGNVVSVAADSASECYVTGNAVLTEGDQSAKFSLTVDEDAVIYFYNFSGKKAPEVATFEVLASVSDAVYYANEGVLLIDLNGDMLYDVVIAK